MHVPYESVGELSRALASRTVSCRQVAQAYLDRIEEVNGALNAIMHIDARSVLAEAELRDAEIARGSRRGPLHGVPFTVKDCFSTASLPTTCGVKEWASFVPRRDAAIVQHLREAGAVLLGKTSLPPFLSSFETDNEIIGRTSNPYCLERSAGGSSGGEAAIVSACGSAFGVGSDRGGSIRVPCHYCGVAGLKPSTGLLSSAGHYLLPIGPLKAEPGPIARHIEDLSLVMDVLAAFRLPPPRTGAPYAIAFYESCDGVEPEAPIRLAMQNAVAALREEGHRMCEAEPPGLGIASDLVHSLSAVHNELFGREVIPEFFEPKDRTEEELGLLAEEWLGRARERAAQSTMSGFEYFSQEMRLDVLRVRVDAFMESYDAILCPVSGSTALPHGFTRDPQKGQVRTNTFLYSLSGNPAVCVPVGLDGAGLPVGLQVVGRKWEDRTALHIAALLEARLGGWTRPRL
jgi:amidase